MALTLQGNQEFTIIVSPSWRQGNLGELDTMEIVYRGPYNKLTSFRNSLTRWEASKVDSNMFLESWPDDGGTTYPKVTLRYTGLRNGLLPLGKKESGRTVQSASSTKAFGIVGQGDSDFTAEIVYYSPTTGYTWISKTAGTEGSAEEPRGNIELISARLSGVELAGDFKANVLRDYFSDQTTSVTHSEELVSGKYWRNTNIKQKIKIPSALTLA